MVRLRALVDPELEDEEVERVRARLRRAGLLAEWEPSVIERPTAEELEQARAAAAGGRPLSEYVSEGRDQG